MPAQQKQRSTRPANPQARIMWITLSVIALAVVAVVIVIVATSSSGGSGDVTLLQVRPVAISGEALPDPEAGAPDNSAGKAVPRIDGKTFGGTSISIKPGKKTLVIGINRADADVQAEIDALVQWHHAYRTPEQLNVITLVTGPGRADAVEPASTWLLRSEWPWPVLVDDEASSAAAALGFLATPAILLIDEQGVAQYRVLGALPVDRLEQEINDRLGIPPVRK